MAVGVATCMRRALNLHDNIAAIARYPRREIERVVTSLAPVPIIARSLTRLTPALHEVVMHVNDCRSSHLNVHVVVLMLAAMFGRDDRVRVEIDAADE